MEEIDKACFGRVRYQDMDSIFVKRSPQIVLFMQKLHMYEIWNELPPLQPPSIEDGDAKSKGSKKGKSKGSKGSKGSGKKSPKKSKSPKASKSPKKSGGGDEFEEDFSNKPEYEKAILVGAVAIPKTAIKPDEKLFVEISAEFTYYDYSSMPPYPHAIVFKNRLYHDYYHIYPYNYERPTPFMVFSQEMILKVNEEYPHGWHSYAFQFDITRLPDSLFMTRPKRWERNSGIHWNCRAYIAKAHYCIPDPCKEVCMMFYKYTIAPVLRPTSERPSSQMTYTRAACMSDDGGLVLTAMLERDVYYQGEEINVAVQISNDSKRTAVCGISVMIEQTSTVNRQIPHEIHIPVGEVIAMEGERGLPISPKNKGWSETFAIRPVCDVYSKYNLAVDGRMSRDKNIFLAESSVMLRYNRVKVEPPPPEVSKKGSKASKGSKGSKGKNKNNASKGSKGKGKKGSKESKKNSKSKEDAPKLDDNCPPPEEFKEVNTLAVDQICRDVSVTYQAVVRLTLKSIDGDGEGGTPMVRVPFILSRNSRYLDRLQPREPVPYVVQAMH